MEVCSGCSKVSGSERGTVERILEFGFGKEEEEAEGEGEEEERVEGEKVGCVKLGVMYSGVSVVCIVL